MIGCEKCLRAIINICVSEAICLRKKNAKGVIVVEGIKLQNHILVLMLRKLMMTTIQNIALAVMLALQSARITSEIGYLKP